MMIWLGKVLVAALAGIGAASFGPLAERSSDPPRGALVAGHGEPSPAPSSELLTVTDDADRERLVIALGPIDLPAHTSHHALEQMKPQTGTLPFDFTIRGYWVEALDQNGDPVPQTVIHHLNLLDPSSRELFLPIMRRVLAASHETKPQHVPGWLLGVPMRGGSEFIALTMLHNPTDRSFEGVSIRLVIEYERAKVLPVYRMYPFHIDVMFPLGSKAFDLPPGYTVKSFEASPAIRAGIVGMGGHLHKYATRLTLEDVTEGTILYQIEPELTPEGEIERVPVLRHRGPGIGHVIYPDHVYRVTAEYFNPTGETIPGGGMGSIAGGVVPIGEWPMADPTDPLYVADYEHVMTSVGYGSHTEGHEHEH